MFVNGVKNKYMKLKELILLIFVLFTLFLHPFVATQSESAVASVKNDIYFEGKSENISLIETFKDTPLIKEGTIDVNFFLNTNNPIKNDDFSLTYQDFAYLCENVLSKTIKRNLKGQITSVIVKGNSKQANLIFTYTLDTKEKDFLIKLAGIKENHVDAIVTFSVNIEDKTIDNSFSVKGVNISDFLLKTACSIIFGERNYNKIFEKMSKKLFWGLGNLSEFGDTELIFKKS